MIVKAISLIRDRFLRFVWHPFLGRVWKYPFGQVLVLWILTYWFVISLEHRGIPNGRSYHDWHVFDIDLEEIELLIRTLAIIGPPAWVWRVQTKKIITFLNNAAKISPNK